MKFSNEAAFEKHLSDVSKEHIAPVYFILSKDESEKTLLVSSTLNSILNKLNSDVSVKRLEDGKKDRLSDELQAYGLFSSKSLLVVEQVDKINKSETSILTDYLQNPNPLLYLVLSATTLSRATRLYKNIEKSGVIVDLTQIKPWEKEKVLIEKVIKLFTREGIKISSSVAQQFIKQVGVDQNLIRSEINKLISYLGNRNEVTRQDIETICIGTNQETIWQFGDLLLSGHLSKAMKIGKAFLADGLNMISLLRQVRSQIQTKFQICSLLSSGVPVSQITETFPYMRGKILEKNIEIARSYGINRFTHALLDIDRLEFSAKNSACDPELLLEMLTIKIAK